MSVKRKYKTFEELYLRTYKLIFLFIHDYTEDWSLAEEVSSVIWAKIAESPESYLKKEIDHLHNYMRVMVKNEMVKQRIRTNRQEKAIAEISAIATASHSAEDEVLFIEDVRQLESARSKLTEEENRLIELRFEKGCSIKETGEELGIKVSAVKMRQNRILKKLKNMIQ